VRYRERVYAPLRGSAAWRAALAGGLTSAVVGALFNDSGPILLAFGIFVLGCVTAYLRAEPELAGPASQPTIGTASAADASAANGARSRADLAGLRRQPPGNHPHG
jgi:hypothetical protein